MKQIMLDLETLGTKPGSVIVSIGAAEFYYGQIISEFYTTIDPKSCVDFGLRLDAGTVMWWMGQSEDARKNIMVPGKSLPEATESFSAWVGEPKDVLMWGNGSDFDNALLGAAYDAIGVKPPWRYGNNRCYRTMKNLSHGITIARVGTHHNALDDAKSQAVHLMQIMKALGRFCL